MKSRSANSLKLQLLLQGRPWFEEWRDASEFADRLRELRNVIGANFEFNRSEAKWLLEGSMLSDFAQLVDAKRIRLNRDDPPDGYVRYDGRDVAIEMTEVMEPGRQRGLEYRQEGKLVVEDDPVEDWVTRADSIPSALKEGLQKKLSNRHAPGTELLIYLNISEWGIRQGVIEGEIRSTLEGSIGSFAVVHVMWKRKLFSSSGETRTGSVSPLSDEFDDEALYRFATQP